MNSLKTPFRLFMSQILDYAGIYPPANLSLRDAFKNFAVYQSDPQAWMLSRFVLPAKRLGELPAFDKKLSFTTLGRGGRVADEFLANLNLDIADIRAFSDARKNAVVDMCEVALPASSLTEKFAANDIVTRTADALNRNGITVFFECPFGEGWRDRAEKLLRALRKVKDKHVGFKLRTGGVTADAFPSIEQVAWAVIQTREAGVPLKCTAGLHHPIRHFNEGVNAKMHGFLNVFGAGVLAYSNGLSQAETQSILEDEQAENFIFDEIGFEWKGLRVANLEIQKARLFATSFGSCSFDEPKEDLQNLNLL
ncbi:MAG: hypothetical protein IPG44_17710 [Anaerolineales bacterium]|jgi:hypothetical protein|nr:hypothetical protein [Anaerolineales bacterium]MCC6987343.1 hypothetical protein [Anaerolineales bacterium]